MKETDTSNNLKLEEILHTLKQDLLIRKVLTLEVINTISKIDLGTLLLDTYVKYPFAPYKKAAIPYNYCVLPRRLKSYGNLAKTILAPFCGGEE